MKSNHLAAGHDAETLQYYQTHADTFISGTASADMEATRRRFLKELPPGARILDFGCGSGRDTKAFLEAGYQADAVDGSEAICRKTTELTGIPVRQMLFQELKAVNEYDGIWACASILHLPRTELIDVLQRISTALKPGGVLYTSFKYGTSEGIRNGRYFTDFTEDTLKAFLTQVPTLQVFDCWLTQDVRSGRQEERWINILARRK